MARQTPAQQPDPLHPIEKTKTYRLISVAGVVVALIVGVHTLLPLISPAPDAFYVKARTTISRDYEYGGGQRFLFVSKTTEGPEGTWAAMLFLAQCTNTGDKSIMIDSFLIEATNNGAKWQDMPVLMTPERGDLYLCTPPDDAELMQLKEGSFTSAAHAKNIAPGETIQGWICIGFGKESSMKQLRMRIRDTSGNEHLIPIEPSVEKPGAAAQTASYSTTKPTIDIDKIPVLH